MASEQPLALRRAIVSADWNKSIDAMNQARDRMIAEALAANAPAAPDFAFDEGIAVPYMQQALRFQWGRVLFFAANPLIFVPIAAAAALGVLRWGRCARARGRGRCG